MSFLDLSFHVLPFFDECEKLHLEIKVDGVACFSANIFNEQLISTQISDDQTHQIQLTMSEKDDQNSILQVNLFSHGFNITDYLTKIGHDTGQYTHNFNGHSNTITESFTNVMGCNGMVEINIDQPFISWLFSKYNSDLV